MVFLDLALARVASGRIFVAKGVLVNP